MSTATGADRAVDTLIIGAGQAGLTTAHLLTRAGRDCLVVDAAHRVGDNWRHQYDSLTLFTPNRVNGLPGQPFPGRPWDFPGKDEVGDYLELYAAQLALPVRLGTRVGHLGSDGSGFRAQTSTGVVHCRNVVIATGPSGRTPAVPACADDLDPAILQLHSSEYRRPGQLRDGPALVVGAAHSGCDIALELAASRPTTLVGRDPGQVPVSWDSPAFKVVLSALVVAQRHVLTRRTPMGRRQRGHVLAHGGPMLRVKRADLADAGVVRSHARVVGTVDGQPQLDDGKVVEVANVIWATGYRHDYSWLDLPVLDESGWPREFRGVARDVDGVFFCGLSYQYAFSSMLLHGVGRDAEYLTRRILARDPSAAPADTLSLLPRAE
ncbi:flavin-containing monooxygenase [Ornithinimicrobium cavernae]|uniref:flavin-containing monooxygenase n=1 Tax=Ornithinimicrobium cavernae TaxID=2666047 RepID=UPI000D699F9C|nr:NAD(P)/FAD-dependent oxidoreductase [Ornithinimicrobium cavernae]